MSASDDNPGTSYPRGGTSAASGGLGIFVDPETEDPLEIWVDLAIPNRMGLIRQLQSENAQISAFHSSPDTSLLILSPRSTHIFDRYAHPVWLPPRLRARVQSERAKAGEQGDNDEWKTKVLLKSDWVGRCVEQGRFLGEDDDWGGLRAGGPPRMLLKSTILPPLQAEISVAAGLSPHPTSADQPSSPPPQTIVPASLPTSRPHGRRDASVDRELHSASEPEDCENEFEVISPEPGTVGEVLKRAAKAQMMADEALEMADRAIEERGEAFHLSPEARAKMLERSNWTRMTSAAARGLRLPPAKKPAVTPIFKDLRVWLDSNYKKRNKLSRHMAQRSATMVSDWSSASHVIGRPHSLITELGSFADQITKSGVTVVDVNWAWDSIHLRTLMSEQEYLIDLHATTSLVTRNAHQNVGTGSDASTAMEVISEPPPTAKTRSAASKLTPVSMTPLSTAKSKGKGKSQPSDEMDTETLVEIFTRHQELFAKGKAVPEIARFMEQRYATYPVLTWRNLLIEWRKKSDRFKGYGQPIAPAKQLVSPAKFVLKSMPEPVHIHPRISYDRPSPIAPYSAHQPPPAKAFMTPEQLDKIFREETDAAPHDTIINTIFRIGAKHGMYAHQAWDTLYRDWRFRRGRFAHLAATSAASASVTAAPQPYSTEQIEKLFRHSQPDPNMTESDRGEALAAMFGQYSKSEWADLYNDWQNKRGRFDRLQGNTSTGQSRAPASAPAPNTPATATPGPSQSNRTHSRYIDHEELVKILQEHEPLLSAGTTTRQLAEILAPEFPSYAVGTWYNYILDFRARKGRFADVPKLSATRAASVISAATTSSETKRNLEEAQASPRKKHRNAYTEEEEMAMAAHVFVRLPMETTSSTAHWADFQLRHRHRTVGAWAEHYRANKDKIGEYVARMGGAERAGKERAGSNDSDGSDGSVQFIREGEDKSKRPHEVIEVLGSDGE